MHVNFVLDQHAQLDFYSASSLKQHSTGGHSEHTSLNPYGAQWKNSKYQDLNPQYTTLEVGMLTNYTNDAVKII